MTKYNLDYLKENIDLEVIHEAMNKVKDTDDIASFKIGDIDMEMFESLNSRGYVIYVDVWDMETPCVSITEENTADEICETLYNGNNIDLATSIKKHGDPTYNFFSTLNNIYGYNNKIPVLGSHIKFMDNNHVLVYIDDLLLHSCNEYLDEEYKETTLFNKFIRNINVWDMITTAVELESRR